MRQMIREFERTLSGCGANSAARLDNAIEWIVRNYSAPEVSAFCPYLSKRLGIAPWIVQCDIAHRRHRLI